MSVVTSTPFKDGIAEALRMAVNARWGQTGGVVVGPPVIANRKNPGTPGVVREVHCPVVNARLGLVLTGNVVNKDNPARQCETSRHSGSAWQQ